MYPGWAALLGHSSGAGHGDEVSLHLAHSSALLCSGRCQPSHPCLAFWFLETCLLPNNFFQVESVKWLLLSTELFCTQ